MYISNCLIHKMCSNSVLMNMPIKPLVNQIISATGTVTSFA